jgi:hypothetical protein
MKLLSLVLATVVIALGFPACATAPKKQESCCSAGGKTCPSASPHGKAKKGF